MPFDPQFYRLYYGDAAHIHDDAELFRHYIDHARVRHPNAGSLIGALEAEHGRLPGAFDAAGYIARYPDLRVAFAHDWQGREHFLVHGRREGRTPPAGTARRDLGAERISLVLEGFDGSGKSTLAAAVAAALGGRVVRPFGGSLGAMLLWLARTGQADRADQLAQEAVIKGIAEAPADAPLVFDRHWVTACRLLPDAHHAAWQVRPDTVICWADLPTTQARLRIRGDAEGAAAVPEAEITAFRTFALENGLPLLDTSHLSPEEAAARLIALLAQEGVANA